VVFEEGRLAAHAGLWPRELIVDGRRLTVGVLVSVATHPDFRQRGYAAQAVQALQDQMQAEGYDLGLLWTAVPDFYHKLGWKLHQPQGATIILTPERLADTPPGECEVWRCDPSSHGAGIGLLHEREPVRFTRSIEESQRLLALPKVAVWVAVANGEVAAYLVHALGCNKRGLIEYGGELRGIVDLVRHVAISQPRDAEMPLLAYHVRPDLIDWANQLGLPIKPLESSKGFGHEMILSIRNESLPPDVRGQLFTWGLDQA
jgi:hypothetical protein